MKNRINLILVCILLFASSVMSQHITSKDYEARKAKNKVKQISTIERSDNAGAQSSIASVSKEAWDVLFTFNAVADASPGLETDGTNFYTTLWNGTDFHRYDMDGSNPETFTVSGVSNVRDMAYDGQYFYGAAANMNLYQMDLANETLVSTISATCSGVTGIRHIAYDPTLDGGNGGFWIGNWSELGAIAMDGSQLFASINGVESAYGSAYDPYTDAANPRLLLFQQTGSLVEIHGYDINTATLTGLVHDASDVPGYAAGSAGGMCIYEDMIFGKAVLAGSIQQNPNLIFGYELAVTCPIIPGYATNLTAIADPVGALSVDVSWNNPSVTISGDPLPILSKVELFLNDETIPIYTNPSPVIGGSEAFTATVSEGGMNTFKVISSTPAISGPATITNVFVGIDVAAISTNLPEWIMVDDVLTPLVTVTNNGVGSQTFDVALTDGTYNETVTVENLAAGESLDVTFPDWTAALTGIHTFTVTASDPGNDVNLANNTFNQEVLVVDGCMHELVLQDSWGDGWNDNTISVSVNGATVLDHVTMETGSTTSFNFFANGGDTLMLEFFADGGWPEECSWSLFDGDGGVILSGSGPDPQVQYGWGYCCCAEIDLAAIDVSPSGFVMPGDVITPSVTVQNNGSETVDNFVVDVIIEDDANTIYSASKNITTPILPDQTLIFEMDEDWSVIEGSFTVTGTVTAVGDENPQNDTYSLYFPGCTNCGNYEGFDGYAVNASTNQFIGYNTDNGSITNISAYPTDPFPMASEYDGCWLYIVHNDFSYVKIDGDGTVIPMGTISGATGTPTGLAYNHESEIMYMLALGDGNIANLYTLDGLTANYLGSGTDQMIIAMDFADDGMLYGPAIADDQLYQINPADGSTIAIGPVGIDLNFGQDVSWYSDGVNLGALYTFAYGDIAAYGAYDIATGAFVQIAPTIYFSQFATFEVFNSEPSNYYTVEFGMYPGEGTVTATVDGNEISSGDLVLEGKDVQFEAILELGWGICDWWLNGEPTGLTSTIVWYLNLDKDIEVYVELLCDVDKLANNYINVYPNPTNGLLNIEILNPAKLEIINTTGNIIYEENIENNSTIDLSDQVPGVYFVKLVSSSETFMKKVILK